ncbi:uncharacterized protein (DUF1330 family) [Pseudomonas fluvialis]|uniref:Uncharacterized protein (DUF1330 family) n=1 Tax=Pseudomonas fluvialis TaxID=1793966 RepID=A0A7X0BQX9_9PSED|nr:DUF1330 domain-containing protein [Pseudomonas fluvialis]MBB6340793.1 uncharacterized protein (DUF1330 family) [Pseudomonas fluvialis]
MSSLNPSREQLANFTRDMPDEGPILMLNLLRYRDAAAYPDDCGHSPCTGREAYKRYSRTALNKVQGVGGRVELMAPARAMLIAPEEEQWDELLLVRYPSKSAFLGMLADPEYRAATVHRTAALADSRLVGCLPSN